MKMMMRIIALAAAATLIATGGLLAQVVPQPVPSSVGSSTSTSRRTAVAVRASAKERFNFDPFSNSGSQGSVLVVPAGEISIKVLAAANEDMTVMARIFQNALRQANLTSGGPNPVFALIGQSVQGARSIYLQGYGALFTIDVSFPLAPGPAAEETPEPQAEAEVDPVWANVRDEIYEPQRASRQPKPGEEAEKYSAEKVESLKTTLITALKHAANIRSLAADEAVVVTVIGQSVSDKIQKIKSLPGTESVVVVEKSGRTRVFKGGVPDDVIMAVPTMLMIRASASDVNSYAKGDLTLDQFRQNVQVRTYPYLGEGSSPAFMTSISTGIRTR